MSSAADPVGRLGEEVGHLYAVARRCCVPCTDRLQMEEGEEVECALAAAVLVSIVHEEEEGVTSKEGVTARKAYHEAADTHDADHFDCCDEAAVCHSLDHGHWRMAYLGDRGHGDGRCLELADR